MRQPLTEEQMQRDIRRGNRFNLIAFILSVVLAAAAIIAFFYLDQYIIL